MDANDVVDDLDQFIFDPLPLSDHEEADDEAHPKSDSHGGEDSPEEPGGPNAESELKPAVRRRARKACVACHKRKVRCDLLSRGHTCTNCRLDSITCVVRQRHSARRARGSQATDAATNVSKPVKARRASVKAAPATASNARRDSTNAAADNVATNSTVKNSGQSPRNDSQVATATGQNASNEDALPGNGAPNTQSDMLYSYYDFIETESISHLAPEDFKFLEFKGCFHLPARPIINELVREYFLHVHPVFPLIDEKLFWEAYNPVGVRNTQFKIPLFVFRAMLFVSCSYASDDTIQLLGFQQPLDARNCMYQRAQLLYQFNTTSNLIALSQGALILTYYCSGREPMANTSWLRLAIQYANSAGVSEYDRDFSMSIQERQTRKRLWWCIILRDRYLPLGVRRSIEIGNDHFDFSQSRLDENDLAHEFDYSQVYDRATKVELAHILVAQIDLAVALTDIISLVYPASGLRSLDKLDYNTMRSMSPKVKDCMNSLGRCYAFFQSICHLHNQTKFHESISLYNGLTRIYFQSARAALCQFASFMIQAEDEEERNEKIKQLGSAMHASITTIAEVIKECVQVKMARYLPVSMVAYLALPIILNSLDVNSFSSSNTRTEAKRRQLRLLNTAMDLYRGRYSGTSDAQNVITQTIEDTRAEQRNLSIPQETTSSMTYHKPVNDWLDIFIHNPAEYLRISFRIDISLSSGYYPKTEALPQRLYLHLDLLSNTPITKSLAPPPLDAYAEEIGQTFLDSPGVDSLDTSTMDNRHLDFLNFNDI